MTVRPLPDVAGQAANSAGPCALAVAGRLTIPSLDRAAFKLFAIAGGAGVIGRIADYRGALQAAELDHIRRAGPKRCREYATGRHFARVGVHALGHGCVAIPTARDRSPTWPSGVIGSITHTDTLALSIVLHQGKPFLGVGIDLELAGQADAELSAQILSCSEQRNPLPADLTLIFSAKEAVYKAVYPYAGTMLEFADVEIGSLAEGAFTARYVGRRAINRVLDTGMGLYQFYEGHWVCVFLIPAPAPGQAGGMCP